MCLVFKFWDLILTYSVGTTPLTDRIDHGIYANGVVYTRLVHGQDVVCRGSDTAVARSHRGSGLAVIRAHFSGL